MPLSGFGTCNDFKMKQVTCSVLNMNYFNVLEDLNIVNKHSGTINGAMDEWIDG